MKTFISPNKIALKAHYTKIFSFFYSSLAGVGMDLVIFQLAIYVTLSSLYANIISSGIAIITTYFFASRYTFKKELSLKRFYIFFIYYATSITFFSFLIDYAVNITNDAPIIFKILSLPISFALNYFFSNLLLSKL